MDVADAVMATGSEMLLYRVGQQTGSDLVVVSALEKERDKLELELKQRRKGLLQEKEDAVLIADLNACLEFVRKVGKAHAVCVAAGSLMASDDMREVDRWLSANRSEESARSARDCSKLQALVVELEQEVFFSFFFLSTFLESYFFPFPPV